MFLIMVNQTVPKYLNCLPNCSTFLEQDEPVREDHNDVPDSGEPNCSQTSIIPQLLTYLFHFSRTRRTCPEGTP
jgi:hypothetical protein